MVEKQVSFVAVGRNIGNDSQATDNLARAYFPNRKILELSLKKLPCLIVGRNMK